MKKVGLLTLPLKDNYGGIVQAVTLYIYLSRLGCEVTLIDKDYFYPLWKKALIFLLERVPLQNLKKFRSVRLNGKKHRSFIDKFAPRKTRRLITFSDLKAMAFEYSFDAVVVGSDQVWRLQYIDKVYYGSYFLDFLDAVPARKVAYAASFGLDSWPAPDKTAEISSLLAGFDALSSRESSGVELCAGFGREDCEHVLDPTLLIERDFYEKIIESLPSSAHNKMLCYVLDNSAFNESVIAQCLLTMGSDCREERIYQKGSNWQGYSIPEWINAFSKADFIVTDSFHGMVFSIIFNKQFIAISNSGRGSSRFESLLDKLGLRSRLISNAADFNMNELIEQPIDYVDVNAVLVEWRKHSDIFLRDAISI